MHKIVRMPKKVQKGFLTKKYKLWTIERNSLDKTLQSNSEIV